MSQKNRRPRTWILTVSLGGGALAYLFLVFLPVGRSVAQLRTELRDKQQHVQRVEQEYLTKPLLHDEWAEARQFVERWKESSADESRLADFLARITQLASESGVHIQRVAPQPPRSHSTVQRIPLNLEIAAPFAALYDFLRRIESSGSPLWITHLSIEAGEESQSNLRCQLSLTVFADNSSNSD